MYIQYVYLYLLSGTNLCQPLLLTQTILIKLLRILQYALLNKRYDRCYNGIRDLLWYATIMSMQLKVKHSLPELITLRC